MFDWLKKKPDEEKQNQLQDAFEEVHGDNKEIRVMTLSALLVIMPVVILVLAVLALLIFLMFRVF